MAPNYIETGKNILEVFKIILETDKELKEEGEQVRQANALLVLLRRMAAKESAAFDRKEFDRAMRAVPHANRYWNVRYADMKSPSFIIDFKPDPDITEWCRQKTPGEPWPGRFNCTLEPKQLGVNMGLVRQFPNWGIIVLFGRDASEIKGLPTAKAIVEWMQNQENGLAMAYGLRELDKR